MRVFGNVGKQLMSRVSVFDILSNQFHPRLFMASFPRGTPKK